MGDTDATGAIYFTSLLRFAVEAFEEALETKGLQIQAAPFLLPIVHAEADFIAPIALGDSLDISLKQKTGNSSISINYEFHRGGALVATASLIHVAIDQKSGDKIAVPPEVFI
jgi:acyl-CoA thioesterase FadM